MIMEDKIQMLMDSFSRGELTQEEADALDEGIFDIMIDKIVEGLYMGELAFRDIEMLGNRTIDIIINRWAGPPTEEQLARWRLQDEESFRNNASTAVLSSNYTPAAVDVDLRTMGRFVFSNDISGMGGDGYSFILDAIFGKIYYEPHGARAFDRLNFVTFSSELKEQDKERLIEAIEESGFRNWEVRYQGDPLPEMVMGSVPSWTIGILFDDGTIMRRRGGGFGALAFPPDGQFDILSNFIRTLGAEIAERHEAESEATESKADESESTESDDEE